MRFIPNASTGSASFGTYTRTCGRPLTPSASHSSGTSSLCTRRNRQSENSFAASLCILGWNERQAKHQPAKNSTHTARFIDRASARRASNARAVRASATFASAGPSRHHAVTRSPLGSWTTRGEAGDTRGPPGASEEDVEARDDASGTASREEAAPRDAASSSAGAGARSRTAERAALPPRRATRASGPADDGARRAGSPRPLEATPTTRRRRGNAAGEARRDAIDRGGVSARENRAIDPSRARLERPREPRARRPSRTRERRAPSDGSCVTAAGGIRKNTRVWFLIKVRLSTHTKILVGFWFSRPAPFRTPILPPDWPKVDGSNRQFAPLAPNARISGCP